jgi:plastocyanin
MMKCGVLVIAAALVLIALAAAGCGSSGESSEEAGGGGTKTIAGLKANDHGSKTVSGEAKVELDDYYFEPTVLKGRPGSEVTLELENEGKVEHNLTIESQQIDQDVEPGEDAKVTVTIPQSGAVSFYCKYHKSQGMAGALTLSGGSGGMSGGGGTHTGTTTSTDEGY